MKGKRSRMEERGMRREEGQGWPRGKEVRGRRKEERGGREDGRGRREKS